jgi:hypothetical protein
MRSIVQSKRSSIASLLGIALAACALSACGIRTDLSPRDIDPSRQTELNGK